MTTATRPHPAPTGHFAQVHGLKMYYEVHGHGQPLVLLHGALSGIGTTFSRLLPGLAAGRQVIATEFQGHGHTADVDRPLRYEHLADDVAELVRHLGLGQADVFGYSLGAGVALQLALRHPDVVRKLVLASVTFRSDGLYPEVLSGIAHLTPEALAGSPWQEEYARTAPRPADWPTLVAKVRDLDAQPQDWSRADLRGVTAPTLLAVGDADVVRPEHAVELFRRLGGGVAGDLAGLPAARLAVLPGTTHVTLVEHDRWLVPMITEFLDTPVTEPVLSDA